jgi:S1-C subfamily serine protease
MRKIISILSFFLIFTILTGCVSKNEPIVPPKIEHNSFIDYSLSTVVQIKVMCLDKTTGGYDEWGGTGFIIHKTKKADFILTDFHIFDFDDKNTDCTITFDHIDYLGHLIHSNKNKDLALIKTIPIDKGLPVKFNYKNYPPIGTEVTSIGYPVKFGLILSKGYIASYTNPNKDLASLQIHSFGFYGGSGSPLFLKNKKVLGILQQIHANPFLPEITYYCPSYDIVKWLNNIGHRDLID